ncbi:MAG TPA: hypothetical protein VEX15_17340 [Nocardioidaceae bacterium]|nr:hypothetical protein [Nocardioidaceae bacterium]
MSSGPTRLLALSLATAATALPLTGCFDDDDPPAPSPDLEVVDVQSLDLPPGDAYLSPDGRRIATYAGRELCVYTADGDKVRCADRPIDLDPNSVQWNSDGSRLVYTEDFWDEDDGDLDVEAGETEQEPDIWTFQTGSGEVTDLTDDGVDPADVDLRDQPRNDQAVDTLPMWIDGSTIRFFRSDDGWDTVAVMQIPAAGGEPEQVGTLPLKFPPESVAYTPDGEQAAYDRWIPYHDGKFVGTQDVALSNLRGRDVETIVEGSRYTVSLSSDGDDALAVPYRLDFDPSNPSIYTFDPSAALSVDGGDATELDEEVQWAAWRPSGDGLIYAEFNENDEDSDLLEFPLRIVTDVNDVGDDARELSDRSFLPPFLHADLRAPVWSKQNTMLLREQSDDEPTDFQYVLVRLGKG